MQFGLFILSFGVSLWLLPLPSVILHLWLWLVAVVDTSALYNNQTTHVRVTVTNPTGLMSQIGIML